MTNGFYRDDLKKRKRLVEVRGIPPFPQKLGKDGAPG
jgi:hypothetical protein